MKKLLSVAIILAIAVSLFCAPVSASRVGTDSPDQTVSTDVTIQLDDAGKINKYYVDINYPTSMLFTYTIEGDTWDPDSYTYIEGEVTGWSAPKEFSVVNHSDMPIKYVATASVTDDSYGDVGISVSGGTGTVTGCAPGDAVGSHSASFSVSVEGVPNANLTSTEVKLGHVDVVISKP